MNYPLYIARRYLFSKKSVNIINLISLISLVVVAVVTCAMVVILSAFNGIEELIDDRYGALDADLTIMPATGKTYPLADIPLDSLKSTIPVTSLSPVIEENVLAEYDQRQRIVRIKGVEQSHLTAMGFDSLVYEGRPDLKIDNTPQALLGAGVRYELSARLGPSGMEPLRLSAILRGKRLSKARERALNRKLIAVGGIFSINVDFDLKYVLVPLDFASSLLKYDDEVSAVEIKLKEGTKTEDAAEELSALLGDRYNVVTRFEKNELIYKTNRSEKWITFFILLFVMLIATFNIVASLVMLILDKQSDIRLLSALGASRRSIRRVFFFEGLLINGIGAGVGLVLGYLLCLLQIEFGLVPLEGGLVPYYPVALKVGDFAVVFAVVIAVGLISSIAPVWLYTGKSLQAKT